MPQADPISRYQALLTVARSLGKVMELNTLLDEILRQSQEVMGAEACTIFLPDKATGELIINSARGNAAPSLFATRIPKGMGVAGSVFENKQTVNIHDVTKDSRHYKQVDAKTGFITRNMICVPLMNNNDCLGVLQALNSIGRDHFDEQDEEVCEAFSGLIVSAFLRLEAQQREIEAVRTRQELELAREIQKSFLPEPLIIANQCRIHMFYTPARHIGGDFCFYHECPGDRLLIGLGDVSGKGVPAALNMARATAMIKALVDDLADDLGKWVSDLNTQIAADLHAGRFIGITFLLANRSNSTLQICAAGQFPPFTSSGLDWKPTSAPQQLPLGILPTFQYSSIEMPLKPGDLLLLFSDGITEARNTSGEDLTESGFLQHLPQGSGGDAAFQASVAAWEQFTQNAPQHDDATLMLLDWRGPMPKPEVTQTCEPSTLCCGREFAENWAKYAGFDDVATGQIVLAFDEAVTNIFRHAYAGKPGPVLFQAHLGDTSLTFTIQDQGTPVNPEKIKGRELDDLRPGGLGTVLLAKVFDTVSYHPLEKGTRLELTKNLPSTAP